MVHLTIIARLVDGLALAEGLDTDKDLEISNYKAQAKVIMSNNPSSWNASLSKASIFTALVTCHALRTYSESLQHIHSSLQGFLWILGGNICFII
jgi:hypothetical protein